MTAIRDDEQVECRLREQAGCSVVVSDAVVQEAADARAAASRAAGASWELVRSSPYAAVLGATERRAPDVDTLAARLTEMRETWIPARVQQIDTGDAKRVSRAHCQAAKARENAAMHRAGAAEARTEKALRARIAEQHPGLHESEVKARAVFRAVQETRSADVAARGSDVSAPRRLRSR